MVGGGGRFGRSAFRISSLGINPVGRPLGVKVFRFISSNDHIYDIKPDWKATGGKDCRKYEFILSNDDHTRHI